MSDDSFTMSVIDVVSKVLCHKTMGLFMRRIGKVNGMVTGWTAFMASWTKPLSTAMGQPFRIYVPLLTASHGADQVAKDVIWVRRWAMNG